MKISTKHTHTYVRGDHITTVVITEHPDCIIFEQHINRIEPNLDKDAFAAWMMPILLPYENDRRPQIWHDMRTGDERIIVDLREKPRSPQSGPGK